MQEKERRQMRRKIGEGDARCGFLAALGIFFNWEGPPCGLLSLSENGQVVTNVTF